MAWLQSPSLSRRDRIEYARLLSSLGADLSHRAPSGESVYTFTRGFGNMTLVPFWWSPSHAKDVCDSEGRGDLHYAAALKEQENFGLIEGLPQNAYLIDMRDKYGMTALMLAAQFDNSYAITKLLDARAALDVRDHKHRTALMIAISEGNTKAAKSLIDWATSQERQKPFGIHALGARLGLDYQDTSGRTALMTAISRGFDELAMGLITISKRENISLGYKDATEWTALHHAAAGGNVALVQSLVDFGVDLKAPAESGKTALQIAAQEGNRAVVEYMIKICGANVHRSTYSILIEQHRFDTWSIRLDGMLRTYQPSVGDAYGCTLLMEAVAAGSTTVLKSLLEFVNNTDFHIENEDDQTFTDIAIRRDSAAVFDLLVGSLPSFRPKLEELLKTFPSPAVTAARARFRESEVRGPPTFSRVNGILQVHTGQYKSQRRDLCWSD